MVEYSQSSERRGVAEPKFSGGIVRAGQTIFDATNGASFAALFL
jgi:hypothetical protein